MHSPATPQHRWLQQLIGDWRFDTEASMGPGEPPIKSSGSEQVRALGELWVLCECEGAMPGADHTHRSVMTLGFDPKRERYVGSFVASMMDSLWFYDGTLDASGKVLTLATDGPSFTGDGSTARYHDTLTLLGPDERTLTSAVQMPDGQWNQFMKATYHRKR